MSPLNDARGWRLRAAELRTIANNCKTPEGRAMCSRLADDYELLAARAEARARAERDRETPTG